MIKIPHAIKTLTRLIAITVLCLPTLNLSAAIISSFAFAGGVTSDTSQTPPGIFQLEFSPALITDNPSREPLAFSAYVQIDTLTLVTAPLTNTYEFDQKIYLEGFRLYDASSTLLATADIDLTGIQLQIAPSNTFSLINELAQTNLHNMTLLPAGQLALQNTLSPVLRTIMVESDFALILTIPYASVQLNSVITSGLLDTSVAASAAVVAIPEPATLSLLLLPLLATTTRRHGRTLQK